MKKITLFGAGNICKQMIPHLREHGYEILAIADNDEAKQGTELWGIPIINPNCLTTRGVSCSLRSTLRMQRKSKDRWLRWNGRSR